MKSHAFLFAGLLVFVFSVSVFGQEKAAAGQSDEIGNWAVNFGVFWRNFRSTKFRNTTPPGYKGVFPRSGADGMVTDYDSNIGNIGTTHRDDAVVVYKNKGKANGKKEVDTSDQFAPELGVSYTFYQQESFMLSAIFGFQYYELDAVAHGLQGNETSSYQTMLPTLPPAPERDSHETAYLTSTARTKMDMSLCSLDLGLKMDYIPLDALHLFMAAGPSLAIVDTRATNRYAVIRNIDGVKLTGGRESDDSVDVIPGIYASVGAEYMFTQHFGASAEIRYDNGFDTADTKYTVQTLDSFGGALKLVWKF